MTDNINWNDFRNENTKGKLEKYQDLCWKADPMLWSHLAKADSSSFKEGTFTSCKATMGENQINMSHDLFEKRSIIHRNRDLISACIHGSGGVDSKYYLLFSFISTLATSSSYCRSLPATFQNSNRFTTVIFAIGWWTVVTLGAAHVETDSLACTVSSK